MKGILIFIGFVMGALSFNPATGSYQNCVIIKVAEKNVTLWDIQKIAIVRLIMNNIYPSPATVEKIIEHQKENFVNFFLVKSELDTIQYKIANKNELIATAKEKLKRKKATLFLKMYGISITSAAETMYQIYRVRQYYEDFIFKVIQISDREVREYYMKNRKRFSEPFEIISEKIKNYLILEKKRRRLKSFIERLKKTEHLEIIYPDFECKVRR